MTELFENYDLEKRPYWQRLVRYLAVTFTLHATLVALIMFVPALRNIFLVAIMLGDAEYVDEAYTRARIEDRAQLININEKFQYPAGYFSKDAPWAVPSAQPDAQIVKEVKQEKVRKAESKPTPTPTPEPTPESTPTASPTPSETEEIASNATPSPTPTPSAEEVAQTDEEKKKQADKEAEEALNKHAEDAKIKRPPKINSKPFKDLIAKASRMVDNGELNIDGSIEMVIDADLNPDGSLKNIRINKKRGDQTLEGVAKEFIQALSASHGLAFLDGIEHLTLNLKLDEKNFHATATTQVASEDRASEMADGYSGLLVIERIRKSGRDEGVIFRNTSISSAGKNIVVKFSLPRTSAGAMLTKYIPQG